MVYSKFTTKSLHVWFGDPTKQPLRIIQDNDDYWNVDVKLVR